MSIYLECDELSVTNYQLTCIFPNTPPPIISSTCISTVSFTENVALRGKATQSGRYMHTFGAAYNAIDGNRESDFKAGSCTHSAEMTDPWWRVDLLESYIITSIIITNRGDCCEHRINSLQINIGNSLQNDGLQNPV